jgi:hypothetical protein
MQRSFKTFRPEQAVAFKRHSPRLGLRALGWLHGGMMKAMLKSLGIAAVWKVGRNFDGTLSAV